ncbi:MAG: Fe-S cluster assembly protein SufD [Acidobacteria bacterium]|nr:Fe-S cluster assembly protein SufD [Acidobacteriota bacterium]
MAQATAEGGLKPAMLGSPRPGGWDLFRSSAEQRLEGVELPGQGEEAWKYLDLRPLWELPFRPAPPSRVEACPTILPEAKASRLVFLNGRCDPHHCSVAGLPDGVAFRTLVPGEAALGTVLGEEPAFFPDLNAARFMEGAILRVPAGCRVVTPLHLLFWNQGGEGCPVVLPRLFVHLGAGAEATLVEEHAGEGAYLSAPVVEVLLEEGAVLDHERIQREGPEAFHFATLGAQVAGRAAYRSRTVSFGAWISRQEPRIRFTGEEAELTLDGLALLGGRQVADTHSRIDHAHPRCVSGQLHKCVAGDRSRAVFNGRILVHPGAQQTDARQQSRNLLLSEEARVDTKPQLEIFADDVKCAHGAAIGQLDPEELFYLQSRGFSPELARNVLTYGFASDLLGRIAVPSLRRRLRHAVLDRTEGGAQLEGL